MKYIVDFDSPLNARQMRGYALSGTNKAEYIANVLSAVTGEKTQIISPALTNKNKGYVCGRRYDLNDNVSVRLFSTFGCKSRIIKGIRYYLMQLRFFAFLLFSIKKREKILVYHEMKYCRLLLLLKKLRKFELILEVEEIYSDVRKYAKRTVKNEYKIIERADKFLFATELLSDKFCNGKPHAIIYGAYETHNDSFDKFNDGLIHVVYSGTFDPLKGGVYTAIDCAEYLDDRYAVHILGFGTDDEINRVKERINSNNANNPCKVFYEGKKEGDEFRRFLQRCDIGLSTQNPEGIYNLTSFPSKILTYISCGLAVVTVRIEVVDRSKISDCVVYYDNSSLNSLADAIRAIDLQRNERRNVIERLDKDFKEKIKQMIS